MNKLPFEIVCYIFEFLPLKSRNRLKRVCSDWNTELSHKRYQITLTEIGKILKKGSVRERCYLYNQKIIGPCELLIMCVPEFHLLSLIFRVCPQILHTSNLQFHESYYYTYGDTHRHDMEYNILLEFNTSVIDKEYEKIVWIYNELFDTYTKCTYTPSFHLRKFIESGKITL